jgi:hypothetical protein
MLQWSFKLTLYAAYSEDSKSRSIMSGSMKKEDKEISRYCPVNEFWRYKKDAFVAVPVKMWKFRLSNINWSTPVMIADFRNLS